MFADLAAILKESQRLKAENRSLRAFVRRQAKGCVCTAYDCQTHARKLLAKLDRAKKVKE